MALNDKSHQLLAMQASCKLLWRPLKPSTDHPHRHAKLRYIQDQLYGLSSETVVPYRREVEQSYEALDRAPSTPPRA